VPEVAGRDQHRVADGVARLVLEDHALTRDAVPYQPIRHPLRLADRVRHTVEAALAAGEDEGEQRPLVREHRRRLRPRDGRRIRVAAGTDATTEHHGDLVRAVERIHAVLTISRGSPGRNAHREG
jgi:hypothetical protein